MAVIRDQFVNPAGFETEIKNTTFVNPGGITPGILFIGVNTSGIDVTDSIFAYCSSAVENSETGGVAVPVNLTNCGLPAEGLYAIGTETTGNMTASVVNSVTADPDFASIDVLTDAYLDVLSNVYSGAASDTGDLAGGADFIGTTINNWENF